MNGRKTLVLICCLVAGISSWAQVQLGGEVKHDGKGLDDVSIQIYEDGTLQRTILANKRGKYEIEVPLNHQYQLVFRRPYMIPARIDVDTRAKSSWDTEGTVVDVPLNMELFHCYKGMDVRAYRTPLGVVRNTSEVLDGFKLHSDKDHLAALKKVNAKSRELEAAGKSPVRIEEVERDESVKEKPETKTKPVAETPAPAKPATSGTTSKEEPAVSVEEETEAVRIDREVEHYDRVEAAETERAKNERALQTKSQVSASDRRNEQENYIASSKSVRSRVSSDEEEELRDVADARVAKQQRLQDDLEAAAAKARIDSLSRLEPTRGIKKTLDSGVILTEEKLLVCEEGVEHNYRKVVYDWLLFDVEYYYKNDTEISKDEYEVARDLFD